MNGVILHAIHKPSLQNKTLSRNLDMIQVQRFILYI
jgi:hypothetical protein